MCLYHETSNQISYHHGFFPKMKNMPDSLHAIDWIITNKDETETYLNLKIESTDDLKIAAKRWNDLGVKNIIVTNGVKELIYRSGEEEIIKSVMPSNSVKDVTGAGDSFCAAVVYSWLNGMSTEDILIAGMVNAKKTIETKYTVRQNLDQQQLYHDMEDYKMANLQKYIEYSREVQQARENNQPIVALESTIISHGMPYPQNVEMATTVEQIIRNNGAIPATIAIIDGKIKIGLESEDLEILATNKDVAKVSRRDLAEIVAMKRIGATTVATTMICAAMAGIQFLLLEVLGVSIKVQNIRWTFQQT